MSNLLVAKRELQATSLAGIIPAAESPTLQESVRELTQIYGLAKAPSREEEQRLVERAIELALLSGGRQRILDGCAAVFVRLGYFPLIESMRRQFRAWTPNIPLRIQVEAAGRIAALSLHRDLERPYTPSQADLHAAFRQETYASISAPTSSGKSFVLGRLIHDFAVTSKFNVAYIVPTRALISEVSGRIRANLRQRGARNMVRTSPVPLPGGGKPAGHIYVLTQERLLALLGEDLDRFHLDVLLVDEAHEVQSGARGILLESAVEAARQRFPRVRLLMASPGIPNPEYLLTITQLAPLPGVGHVDRRSPVLHNYFELRAGTDETEIILHASDGMHVLGSFKDTVPGEHLAAWAALLVHQRTHTTLVYCRSPNEAELTAEWLAKRLPDKSPVDKEVAALADYIEREVHPGHPLAPMLKKGLATHYGKMPPIVKNRVEVLAASGKIEILCCTSTLLSGVNLPCRNMVMHDPHKGKGNPGIPLTEAEIRNLAGRAGRVDSDLVGNVWVVGTSTTPARIPQDRLPPIKTQFEAAIQQGGQPLLDFLDPEVTNPLKNELGSAFAARAFDLAVHQGKTLVSLATNPATVANLQRADNEIAAMRATVKVPADILRRHHSVSPSTIQRLYELMLEQEKAGKLEKWIPLQHRISPKRYDELDAGQVKAVVDYDNPKLHFAKAMPFLAESFKDNRYMWPEELEAARQKARAAGARSSDWPDKAAWRLATIAAHWINAVPLGMMLRTGVVMHAKRQSAKEPFSPHIIRDGVRETMTTIEDDVRFRLSLHWRLIQDLLRHIYRDDAARQVELAQMVDLPLKLEFGTVSEEALAIMGLGFSRAVTAEIRRAMRKEGVSVDSQASNVIDWVLSRTTTQLQEWGMDLEVWLELCVVAGRDSSEIPW